MADQELDNNGLPPKINLKSKLKQPAGSNNDKPKPASAPVRPQPIAPVKPKPVLKPVAAAQSNTPEKLTPAAPSAKPDKKDSATPVKIKPIQPKQDGEQTQQPQEKPPATPSHANPASPPPSDTDKQESTDTAPAKPSLTLKKPRPISSSPKPIAAENVKDEPQPTAPIAPSAETEATSKEPTTDAEPQDATNDNQTTHDETTRITIPSDPAAKPSPLKTSQGSAPENKPEAEPPKSSPEAPADKTPTQEAPAVPKRPVLKSASERSGAPKLSKPVPIGIKKKTIDLSAPPGSKKSTSRISLPSPAGANQNSTSGKIKTIKIAPRSTTTRLDQLAAPIEEDSTPKPPAATADAKRQTSRISLESALGEDAPKPNKTIKIKKGAPASNTVKLNDQEEPPDTESPEATPSGSAAQPESKKQTLRVKRPAASQGATSKSTGATSPMFTPPQPIDLEDETPVHWIFGIVAIAASIITAVLIYILAAQVTSPDPVESPNATGEGLPYPARITL